MNKTRFLAIALVLSLLTIAISTHAEPATRPAGLTHIVVCWLKTPGDAEARQKLIDGSKGLSAIPGVISVSSGVVIPSTRPVVVSDYDVALVLTFADAEALAAYVAHPIHQKLVKELIVPLVKEYKVYDFANR